MPYHAIYERQFLRTASVPDNGEIERVKNRGTSNWRGCDQQILSITSFPDGGTSKGGVRCYGVGLRLDVAGHSIKSSPQY
jgi:hypothetical protein